mgnify:CR=1 FL=1
MEFRHNELLISSLSAFQDARGTIQRDVKQVCFVRLKGYSRELCSQLRSVDACLNTKMARKELLYTRISSLSLPRSGDVYIQAYEAWKTAPSLVSLPCSRNNAQLAKVLGEALDCVLSIYRNLRAGASDSILRNFAVKLLYWTDELLQRLPGTYHPGMILKIIGENVQKDQEYLFFYFLTMLGADVLLLQTRGDVPLDFGYLRLSADISMGPYSPEPLPPYDPALLEQTGVSPPSRREAPVSQRNVVVQIPKRPDKKRRGDSPTVPSQTTALPQSFQPQPGASQGSLVRVQIPPRRQKPGALKASAPSPIASTSSRGAVAVPSQSRVQSREKSFEELALLAASVVMVAIADERGEVGATGSGIMVGEAGYILTNNHVIRGGQHFLVRIENDDQVYETTEVIKYNQVLDLALIRIARRLSPLRVYAGANKPVRGQKVVAIGSPLGLFNSVSDGIISGFRVIDHVDMIQFTAPISHGSSGGAVLNMQGEVIGISTAGFDRGQNINLAVPYDAIQPFIRGFIS